MIASELAELKAWIGDPPRHPDRTHDIDESDAEVVRIRDDLYLATSTDAVDEEIATGLYSDPYSIGWLTATAGLADIAAVGADPVGVLFTSIWGHDFDPDARERVAAGFGDALRAAGTALLGGDTGSAAATVLTATAVGTAPGPPMRRLGARAGDHICVTGRTGAGPAFAVRVLSGDSPESFPDDRFRPVARVREGARLRPLANACTDASDGLFHAVRSLATMNGLGAALRWTPDAIDAEAADYLAARGLPRWLAWVVEISDFELVAAVPAEALEQAQREVESLVSIGRFTEGGELSVDVDGTVVELDPVLYPSLAHTPDDQRVQVFVDLVTAARERGLP